MYKQTGRFWIEVVVRGFGGQEMSECQYYSETRRHKAKSECVMSNKQWQGGREGMSWLCGLSIDAKS
jgi:hypothetical protein